MDSPEPTVAFDRQKMIGAKVKFGRISGLEATITDTMRLGAYRNRGTTIEATTTEVKVAEAVEDAAGSFDPALDGIDVMPYLEYIGAGSSFEMSDVEVTKESTESKQVANA